MSPSDYILQTPYHAFVVVGDIQNFVAQFREKVSNQEDVELRMFQVDSLGIDLARTLREFASVSSYAQQTYILVTAHQVTGEAQNALLKAFEEPREGLTYILVVPRIDILLATLLSRCRVLQGQNVLDAEAVPYLKKQYGDRIEFLLSLCPDSEDENRREKLATLASFFSVLEKHLYATKTGNEKVYKTLWQAKKYLGDTAPAAKMLAEQVSLVIPRF